VDQARLLYDRVKYVFQNNDALRRRFKATGHRGIRSLNHTATYSVRSNNSDGLQGIPVDRALLDEGHLLDEETYNALVLGTSATNGQVVMITTAGDEKSELLKRLVEYGREVAT